MERWPLEEVRLYGISFSPYHDSLPKKQLIGRGKERTRSGIGELVGIERERDENQNETADVDGAKKNSFLRPGLAKES